jgi:large subunit ribosomal protein L18
MKRNVKSTRKKNIKVATRNKRRVRIRKKVFGSAEQPRLAVFRSAQHIYVQAIDDEKGCTLAQASTMEKSLAKAIEGKKKKEAAALVGEKVAERLKLVGVTTVIFDRGGFSYTGRIAEVADGARKAGLQF